MRTGDERLLGWFFQIGQLRSQGMNGPNPIEPGILRDWMQMTGNRLYREEISILLHMDGVWINACRREAERNRPKPEDKEPEY